METHDSDPTSFEQSDPWDGVSEDLGRLGEQLRETYRRVAQDRGPTDQEIKEALATLAGAWDQVAESVATALKDPVIREQLKEAASSFAGAIGATITELGAELRRGKTDRSDES